MVWNLFLKDEMGQGAAEYILLFGGIIVIAIAVLLIYRSYVESTNPLNASEDINRVRSSSQWIILFWNCPKLFYRKDFFDVQLHVLGKI